MRPAHDDDEIGAGLGHHLCLEISAVHGLQIGDDRVIRKPRAEGLDGAEAFGENQRRPRLEPVDAGLDAHRGRIECLLERRQVE